MDKPHDRHGYTSEDSSRLESMIDPGAKVVDGFADGLMPGHSSKARKQREV
jgi:hypothetical protein